MSAALIFFGLNFRNMEEGSHVYIPCGVALHIWIAQALYFDAYTSQNPGIGTKDQSEERRARCDRVYHMNMRVRS